MTSPQVAIIQYPGSNCEYETAAAVRSVGLGAEIFRWNRDPEFLRGYSAYIIPGGFSYQDRIRAGAIAARKPLMTTIREMAEQGRPVLGICNGAQVLVEAGLVPDTTSHEVKMALATNFVAGRTGYYCTWTTVRVMATSPDNPFLCAFEEGETFPIPIAHGEGRFISQSDNFEAELRRWRQIALCYCTPEGEVNTSFPFNPNGSLAGIAGITNKAGNVLAMMPHPERCASLFQIPETLTHSWAERRRQGQGSWSALRGPGPGLRFFESLQRYLTTHSVEA